MSIKRCKECGTEIVSCSGWLDRHHAGIFRRTGLCYNCLHATEPANLECKPEDASDDCDIVCPWCGYAYQAECTDYGEYEKELECMHCEREFTLYEFHTVTYHTEAKGIKP